MPTEKTLAWLRIEGLGEPERVEPITGSPFKIGRDPKESDLVLDDPKVSRHHACLWLEDDQIELVDQGSSNGTFLGSTRLEKDKLYRISHLERFQIGSYTLELLERLDAGGTEIEGDDRLDRLYVLPPAEPEPPPDFHVDIGLTAAPPPPGQPPTVPKDGYPSDNMAFGLPPEQSRYLAYLPPLFAEHPFLGRFLLAFEGVIAPIEQVVDNFDLYLDPQTAPDFFLDQLGAWLGLTPDEKWPLDKRRALLAEGAELYRRRGSRWSLSRHLEIYTGVKPEQIEIIELDDQPHHFRVVLALPSGQAVDRDTVERIIQGNKPAHTTYDLRIVETQL